MMRRRAAIPCLCGGLFLAVLLTVPLGRTQARYVTERVVGRCTLAVSGTGTTPAEESRPGEVLQNPVQEAPAAQAPVPQPGQAETAPTPEYTAPDTGTTGKLPEPLPPAEETAPEPGQTPTVPELTPTAPESTPQATPCPETGEPEISDPAAEPPREENPDAAQDAEAPAAEAITDPVTDPAARAEEPALQPENLPE